MNDTCPMALPRQVLRVRYAMPEATLHRVKQNVWQCKAPSGDLWYLKCMDTLYQHKFAALETVYVHLAQAGLTPLLYPDKDGRSITQLEGQCFLLQKAVAPLGAVRGTSVAHALARLHTALRALPAIPQLTSHFEGDTAILVAWAETLGLLGTSSVLRNLPPVNAAAQLVHGDAHPGNMGRCGQRMVFLDFDSACLGSPHAEASFAAYRLCPSRKGFLTFLRIYAEHCEDEIISEREALTYVFYHIMQRTHFILAALERGERRFLYDLPAQMRRLQRVTDRIMLLK